MDKDKLQTFENKNIRTVWDETTEEWYFSIVDVIGVLTDQPTQRGASNYWAKLKERLKGEGAGQLLTNCQQLKMKSPKDGKYYTDYSLDKENRVLREVKQNEKVTLDSSYTYNKYKITFKKYDGGGDTSNLVIKNSNNKTLYENNNIKTFIGEELSENKPYIENGNYSLQV